MPLFWNGVEVRGKEARLLLLTEEPGTVQHGFLFVTCFDCIITIRYGFFPIDICYKEIRHLSYCILVLGVVGFISLRRLQ